MGQLATPYRIIYQAKNFMTGVTGVVAFVMKPNNAIAGPFPMVEMASPFIGHYYADFYTSNTDPEGEYLELVFSPNEGIRSSKKFGLFKALSESITELEAVVAGLEADLVVLNTEVTQLTTEVNALTAAVTNIDEATSTLNQLSKSLASMVIPGSIKAILPFPNIKAIVYTNNSIVGVVSDENAIEG